MPPASRRRLPFARLTWAFVATVVVTHVLSSLAQTGFVLLALADAGASFTPRVVLATALHDMHGLAFRGIAPFPLILAFGYLLALPVAALMVKLAGGGRRWLYPLAGATMMGCLLGLTQLVFFGITLYAGTRGAPALTAQILTGAVGGYLFTRMLEEKTP